VVDLNESGAQSVARSIGNSVGFGCDVSNERDVDSVVSRTISRFGALDILVSNAGHQFISSVVDLPYDQWKKMMTVHVDGSFLFTRAVLKHLYTRPNCNGKIIYMGSIHSKEASLLKSPYVTAKHALLGLTRAVAKEAGPHGISANLICPGFVRTPLVEKQIPEQARNLNMSEDDVVKKVMLVNTVDKQFSTIDDIAQATLFFASFSTNALTGQSLNVSHGWHMD